MTRDEIIKLASQAIDDTRSAVSLPIPFVMRFAALVAAAERAERAEREKQEPVAWMNEKNSFICKDPKNADFCVPLYAAPRATAPVRLTDEDFARIYDEAGFDPNEMREAAEHMFDAIQSAVLRANGFDIQPARGED